MKVNKPIGSKERFFEMFERVNKVKLTEGSNINQEIYDELEMRYSKSLNTIPLSDINDVAEIYNSEFEKVAHIAADVIGDITNEKMEELHEILYGYVDVLNRLGSNVQTADPNQIIQYVEKNQDDVFSKEEIISTWNKLSKYESQLSLFESSAEALKFKYDNNGNWIPQGFEDKRVGIRKVEQPMGSGNVKYLVVMLSNQGDVEDIIDRKDTWEQAAEALYDSIN